MALLFAILLTAGFIGAAVVLHAAGRSKSASDAMIREYSTLLADAREKRKSRADRNNEDEEAGEIEEVS